MRNVIWVTIKCKYHELHIEYSTCISVESAAVLKIALSICTAGLCALSWHISLSLSLNNTFLMSHYIFLCYDFFYTLLILHCFMDNLLLFYFFLANNKQLGERNSSHPKILPNLLINKYIPREREEKTSVEVNNKTWYSYFSSMPQLLSPSIYKYKFHVNIDVV